MSEITAQVPREPMRVTPIVLASFVVALGLIVVLSPRDALAGCVSASCFCVGLPLGAMLLANLHTLTGGTWGDTLAPRARQLSRATPITIFAIGFVLLGLRRLYPAMLEVNDGVELPAFRRWYFSYPNFITRQVLIVMAWLALAWLLRRNVRAAAAPSMLIIVLSVNLLAVDWIGSLDVHFRSSILGLYVCSNFALTGLSLAVLLTRDDLDARSLRDHGNLLLTFVFVHAYLAFSQYLIIWSGNLPSEIGWYIDRGRGAWGGLAAAMILFQFVVPMALLLFRDVKQRRANLRRIAAGLLLMNWLESAWFVLPSVSPASSPMRSALVGWTSMSLATLTFVAATSLLCQQPVTRSRAEGDGE